MAIDLPSARETVDVMEQALCVFGEVVDNDREFQMGVSDGMNIALGAAQQPDLSVDEVVAKNEISPDLNRSLNYALGSFAGALAVVKLISKEEPHV